MSTKKPSQLKVTLVKSLIGRSDKHQATVRGLGLRKIRSSSLVPDTPEIRGMITSVEYLLDVEQVEV